MKGEVQGPASSTDNGIPIFDGTTGKTVKSSNFSLEDWSSNVGIKADESVDKDLVILSKTGRQIQLVSGTTSSRTPLLWLDESSEHRFFNSNVNFSGNDITNVGNVDGRDVSADGTKLDGIETGAEVNNISDANATDLTDNGESTLHYHDSDRNRANHTGTQTMSTISDAGDLATKDTVASTDLVEGFYRGRYQANTTNSAETGITVQFGWGYITGAGTSRLGTKTVTFPTSYTTILSVTISPIGAYTGAGTPSSITDFTALSDNIVNASSITTSSFEALSATRSGGDLIADREYGFTWVARGIV